MREQTFRTRTFLAAISLVKGVCRNNLDNIYIVYMWICTVFPRYMFDGRFVNVDRCRRQREGGGDAEAREGGVAAGRWGGGSRRAKGNNSCRWEREVLHGSWGATQGSGQPPTAQGQKRRNATTHRCVLGHSGRKKRKIRRSVLLVLVHHFTFLEGREADPYRPARIALQT